MSQSPVVVHQRAKSLGKVLAVLAVVYHGLERVSVHQLQGIVPVEVFGVVAVIE